MRKVNIVGYDNTQVRLEVTNTYPLKRWKEGKCWAAWCSNPIYFIHLNSNGRATHGYCYHFFASLENWEKRSWIRRGERWVHIEKGKIVIDWQKK